MEKASEAQSSRIEGPWRATRLWNDIVRDFHGGMPRKKHRVLMRSFDDCFTASEAIDYMHKSLRKNPNFGSDVTREQAMLLLQKMHLAGIVAAISDAGSNGSADEAFRVGGNGGGSLFRIVERATENLHTPGKKSPLSKLTPLSTVDLNSSEVGAKLAMRGAAKPQIPSRNIFDQDNKWETRSECTGMRQKKASAKKQREEINRSYFQSLPLNSLIILDNDETWKSEFVTLFASCLGEATAARLDVNISNVIYNMTKVSSRGIVQLRDGDLENEDLPHWVLSAMKTLANWPKPLKMRDGSESSLPDYPGFAADVFTVVKDYFMGLGHSLIPIELLEFFTYAFCKGELISANLRFLPAPSLLPARAQHHVLTGPASSGSGYLETNLDSVQTSTPTVAATNPIAPSHCHYYLMKEFAPETYMTVNRERTAKIRQTFELMPQPMGSVTSAMTSPSSSSLFDGSSMAGSFTLPELSANRSSSAILRVSLPPNTCFETAFVNENPITRIVPQREAEILHFQSQYQNYCRPESRPSSAWDTRSIATQTSVDTSDESSRPAAVRRHSRFRRSSHMRKSIAVMEFPDLDAQAGFCNPAFQVSPGAFDRSSSVDNILHSSRVESRGVFSAYATSGHQQSEQKTADNVIFSKTVRKEKRKQRAKRERASSVDRSGMASSGPGCTPRSSHLHSAVSRSAHDVGFGGSDMHVARAEPYNRGALGLLSDKGASTVLEAFQLLGLLVSPTRRRKIQLLLKFMRRIASNDQLRLRNDVSNHSLMIDTFCGVFIQPRTFAAHEMVQIKKIVQIFFDHNEAIWTPSATLRREVEEKVYQSLVNKRLQAGEDPYPITFCQRIPTKVYEQERMSGAKSALLDLLQQILESTKLSTKEKKKKLQKFKEAYPEIYTIKFPSEGDEPEYMRAVSKSGGAISKFSSLTRLKNAIRI